MSVAINHPDIVEPNGTIGILGGGQLGRMLGVAAAELGLKCHIYCPDERAPAYDIAAKTTIASYTDQDALAAFAADVDVITYEFENVPAESVAYLTGLGAKVRPGAKALETSQDRLVEKQFVNTIGAKTAAFHPVDDLSSLKDGLAKVGRPAILKTRRFGYDGKGQTRIKTTETDLSAAFEKAIAFAWEEVGAAPSILEGFVPFEREISIIGARSKDGQIRLYDPAENVHRDGILKTSSVPATITDQTAENARAIATKMLQELDYVGVMGVEFFVLKDGDLIVNEYAPRVHNSGHWTQDACAISQFEQHIRAVAGWPLGDPRRHSNAVMENLIGDEAHNWRALASEPDTGVHLYGKREARPGRKMGHVTRITKP
ncbi:5-(carboxyamino)imidazole ribonucleotide synthase [Hyphococcus sp. DH-69]|uniref:5-(carboxyamino)imidazole ribonucleotide synthase n=1 Tax=Hyphococcus formosus TaxID=3143534 RepID=UPI00398A92CE